MNKSDDTNDLESYGVWVKNTNSTENDVPQNKESNDGLPDFDDTDFSDMFKDDTQFATEDTNEVISEEPAVEDSFADEEDSTLSTDELANITDTGDVTIEEVSADDFAMDEDFAADSLTEDTIPEEPLIPEEPVLENDTTEDEEMPDFTEISVEPDETADNSDIPDFSEEITTFNESPLPSEDSEPTHEFEESGEITFGEDEEMVRKFYINKVLTVKPYRSDILLHVKDIEEYTEKYEEIRDYYGTNDGHNLFIHIDNTSRIVQFEGQVTEAILHNRLNLNASLIDAKE